MCVCRVSEYVYTRWNLSNPNTNGAELFMRFPYTCVCVCRYVMHISHYIHITTICSRRRRRGVCGPHTQRTNLSRHSSIHAQEAVQHNAQHCQTAPPTGQLSPGHAGDQRGPHVSRGLPGREHPHTKQSEPPSYTHSLSLSLSLSLAHCFVLLCFAM